MKNTKKIRCIKSSMLLHIIAVSDVYQLVGAQQRASLWHKNNYITDLLLKRTV